MIHFLSEFICSEGILAIFEIGQICLLSFPLRFGFVVVKMESLWSFGQGPYHI